MSDKFAERYCKRGIHGFRKINGVWRCVHCGAINGEIKP